MTAPAPDTLTHVELIWFEKRIEQWIRFGHDVAEQILDRRRRILSFAPGSIFAYVRWAANDFGTVVSRIDILRAVMPGEAFSTVPLRATGRRDFSPPFRLAQGRARAPGHRRRRAARRRSCRCLSRSLAATPQPARVRRTAARLHRRPPSRLASAPEDRRMTRFGRITATSAAALGLGLSALFRPAPRLIWNASASVPIGLYAVHPAGALHVNELLVVMPPEPLATFLDERRYLPQGVPLLKHVLALPGQTVCRSDRTITVDGVAMGDALDRDHLQPPAARLARLPRRRRRRCLPHEPAVRGSPSTAGISARSPPPPSSAGPIHSGPTRSTDHAAILLPATRYAATISARLLLLPGQTARRSQHGDASAPAPLALFPLGQRCSGVADRRRHR